MSDFVRKGDCNRCGDCCKPRFHISDEARDFYVQNGLPENGQCQFLALIDGLWTCTIHAERPDHCRRFPWHPDQIRDLPGCSYVFERSD